MTMLKKIQIPTITEKDNQLLWGGVLGASRGLYIAELAKQYQGPILVITSSIHQAESLGTEIDFFYGEKVVDFFSDWETLPYDHFSPHQDITSSRLALLAKLPQQARGITVANISTVMHNLMPSTYLTAHSLIIKVGDELNRESMLRNLTQNGYRNVGQVMEHGEFSVRGSIIDLFPMGSTVPYRIEFFDNQIDTIRSFQPDEQRSLEKLEQVYLLPAREFPLNEQGIEQFRSNFREHFSGNASETPLYQQVSQGEASPGLEYYLPLFYPSTSTFFDYLPENTLIILEADSKEKADIFWQEVQHRYEQLRHDRLRPLCEPKELFTSPDQLFSLIKEKTKLKLVPETIGRVNFKTSTQPDVTVDHRAKEPFKNLTHYLESQENINRVLLCAESTGRRETLIELLNTIRYKPKVFKTWQDFLNDSSPLGIITAPLLEGVELTEINVSLICESQLFGKPTYQRGYQKTKALDPSMMIRNLTELQIGAPVVHLNHGIGRYLGLKTIETDQVEAEYLMLEYANADKIYVPVGSLNLISRYTGADSEHAPLQKLGSKQWDKIKSKAAEQIRDVAAELLDVYSRREAAKGFSFKIDQQELQTFAQGFPFEETPDQLRAIEEVIADMQSEHCMDRLVCGDVGFGKTEVAMRAAFVATQNNKQVAVLVPTTLLANQHLQNFQDRFSELPIKVSGLSRFTAGKEQAITLGELATGKLDIVIGTHKLLAETIKFKDLGLLIIDEEQRFGVRQKEKIKALRAQVDILTLTATPIPRTLNMALAGTRNLSIIATPPARRLSVKTFIHEESKSLIREAILREAMRGGQVYFLHNDVATIQAQKEQLKTIVPEARIEVAHGQMPERQLEKIMSDFYHQRFNVLVSTTIIESGIDIQSANTIIINRADRFGLAQLHQLRGRVGRSHHQAYAYLITPPVKGMTKDAVKRLEAIAHLGDLGIGFSLATYDLEIRGAGELLGEEQSGQMHAIGFSLYMEMLEEAVAALKSGKDPALLKPLKSEIEVDLNISALLPQDYVGDVQLRLSLYKRLANCGNIQEMQHLKEELIDRFGLLPEPAQNLFALTLLKHEAQKLGINKIEITSKYGYLHFNEKPNINPEKLILLIQKQPKNYQLQGSSKLRFCAISPNAQERITHINTLINLIKYP